MEIDTYNKLLFLGVMIVKRGCHLTTSTYRQWTSALPGSCRLAPQENRTKYYVELGNRLLSWRLITTECGQLNRKVSKLKFAELCQLDYRHVAELSNLRRSKFHQDQCTVRPNCPLHCCTKLSCCHPKTRPEICGAIEDN